MSKKLAALKERLERSQMEIGRVKKENLSLKQEK